MHCLAFFNLDLAEGFFGQDFNQSVGLVAWDPDFDLDDMTECFVYDLVGRKNLFDIVDKTVGKGYLQVIVTDNRNNHSGFDVFACAFAVGSDQPAGAQFDSPEIADHHTNAIRQTVFAQDIENRQTGGAARFPVVAVTAVFPARTDDKSTDMMGGIGITHF